MFIIHDKSTAVFWGPFETKERALEWGKEHLRYDNSDWKIENLYKPLG